MVWLQTGGCPTFLVADWSSAKCAGVGVLAVSVVWLGGATWSSTLRVSRCDRCHYFRERHVRGSLLLPRPSVLLHSSCGALTRFGELDPVSDRSPQSTASLVRIITAKVLMDRGIEVLPDVSTVQAIPSLRSRSLSRRSQVGLVRAWVRGLKPRPRGFACDGVSTHPSRWRRR